MKACPQCNLRYPDSAVYCFLDGAEVAPIRDARIGTTLAGRYVIESVIGEGGMATVYRARHKLIDRPCAIKVMNAASAADATVRERFRREAKSAQMLAHPNVIEIFDSGETDDGVPYIVMELLDGQELAELVAQGPMPPARAIPILIQMARGIARAHDLGVVHRDLKPENVYVCRRADGSDLVKLLDFGIARSKTDSRLTSAGELFGTPQYIAPERVTAGETGPSVDMYALGVIAFELATGKLPFEASDAATFLVMHMKEKPPMARSIHRGVPEKLEAIVMQLLEKDPKARPVDAHRVGKDLVELAKSLHIAVPPEAEEDPASSREPARSLPAVTVHEWVHRSQVFEQMLARAYGSSPPREMAKTLGELTKLVRAIDEVRAASGQAQHALEEVDQRGREGRQRFGFAVDALGLDASKARDEVRAARAAMGELSTISKIAAEAFVQAQRDVVSWEGRVARDEPHARLAKAYRECADAVDAWLAARTKERAAQSSLDDKERAASDLDYQIRELRGALANHEQAIERDRAAAEARIVELNADAETLEAQALHLATRFCEPLRARPELGPLFQQLETVAAANG